MSKNLNKPKVKRRINPSNKPGPKSVLNEELKGKIRTLYLEDYNFIQIQKKLNLNAETWSTWVYDNYKDFRTFLIDIEKELHFKTAKKVSSEILNSSFSRKYGGRKVINDKVMSVVQRQAQFVLETLGKEEGYSKRTELTGKGGKDLVPEKPILAGLSDE